MLKKYQVLVFVHSLQEDELKIAENGLPLFAQSKYGLLAISLSLGAWLLVCLKCYSDLWQLGCWGVKNLKNCNIWCFIYFAAIAIGILVILYLVIY